MRDASDSLVIRVGTPGRSVFESREEREVMDRVPRVSTTPPATGVHRAVTASTSGASSTRWRRTGYYARSRRRRGAGKQSA